MTAINQELYEALIAAGTPDDLAKRAAASVLNRDDLNQLATKTDIAELKADLIKWMAGLIIGSVVAMTGIFAALVRLMIPA
ncbi:MAG: integrase [Gammaproteobacteria bacterium]